MAWPLQIKLLLSRCLIANEKVSLLFRCPRECEAVEWQLGRRTSTADSWPDGEAGVRVQGIQAGPCLHMDRGWQETRLKVIRHHQLRQREVVWKWRQSDGHCHNRYAVTLKQALPLDLFSANPVFDFAGTLSNWVLFEVWEFFKWTKKVCNTSLKPFSCPKNRATFGLFQKNCALF